MNYNGNPSECQHISVIGKIYSVMALQARFTLERSAVRSLSCRIDRKPKIDAVEKTIDESNDLCKNIMRVVPEYKCLFDTLTVFYGTQIKSILQLNIVQRGVFTCGVPQSHRKVKRLMNDKFRFFRYRRSCSRAGFCHYTSLNPVTERWSNSAWNMSLSSE